MRRVSPLLKLLLVVPQASSSHARYFTALPPEPGTFQGHNNRLNNTGCSKRTLGGWGRFSFPAAPLPFPPTRAVVRGPLEGRGRFSFPSLPSPPTRAVVRGPSEGKVDYSSLPALVVLSYSEAHLIAQCVVRWPRQGEGAVIGNRKKYSCSALKFPCAES